MEPLALSADLSYVPRELCRFGLEFAEAPTVLALCLGHRRIRCLVCFRLDACLLVSLRGAG
jgi:hypothetical protein